MKGKLSQLELVVLGVLFGILANGFYELFKILASPIFGKQLTYSDNLDAFASMTASVVTLFFFLLLYFISYKPLLESIKKNKS